MTEFLIKNIFSIAALIISLITILYTRSNLKLQKYIETITVQRIKWIDILRQDLSAVLADTVSLCYYEDELEQANIFLDHVGFDSIDDEMRGMDAIDKLKKITEKMRLDISRSDIIKNIELSMLRLNYNDHKSLIQQLDELKDNILERKYKSCIEKQFIQKLRNEIAILLKNEWEKVKLEVRKGSLTNLSRKSAN